MSSFKIVAPRNGVPRALYHPDASKVLGSVGEIQTRRVARVEPTDSLSEDALHWLRNNRQLMPQHLEANVWWSDLTLVGGPVLGPYNLRETALAQEIEWLEVNKLPAERPPHPLSGN